MDKILHEDFKDFMSLSKEERRASAIDSMWETVGEAIQHIAMSRRTAEITFNIEPEEFDKRLNEMCEEAYKKFGDMTEKQIANYMLMRLLEKTLGE